MFFRCGNGLALLKTTTVFFCLISSINAEEPAALPAPVQLLAQPENCVALNEGRTCFAQITLTWHADYVDDFCIYQKTPKKVMQCWQKSRGNEMVFEFESSEKMFFQLVAHKDKLVIAEAAIDVSWVHKATPRKRRWRLF